MSIPLGKRVIDDLQAEVIRSVQLWGEKAMMNPNMPEEFRLPILVEEVGEVAKAMNENEPEENMYTELIQVGAMSLSWAFVIRMRINAANGIAGTSSMQPPAKDM